MLFSLLATLLLAPASPPTYSAVVVDAATNRPLPGVAVRNTAAPTQGTSTDARGVFTLGGSPTGLDLSLLGYAPLHATVPAQPTGADTLRLLPQSYALPAVAVRPPKPGTLSSVPADGPELGRRLYPGQAVALLLERPASAPADQPCVVTQVNLYLREKPKQGRLRVRLVGIEPATATLPARPGSHDLLPSPVIFTTEQMEKARKGLLTLDLTSSNLLLPAQGLCVVVDCLASDPADQAVVINSDGKGHMSVVLAPAPGATPTHTYAGEDFPMLEAKRGVGSRTWSRYPDRPEWTTRSTLFYTVHAEVQVLSY